MPTRLENLYRVRDYLDSPRFQSPNFHRMLQQELAEEMDIVNQAMETGRPWATATTTLNYNPNQDTYQIGVQNFGKVLYVVRVTGNCLIPYLNVPFDDVTDQKYGTLWNWNYTLGNLAGGWTETAEHMSFYRESVLNARTMVKIQPKPNTCVEYIITYLPGYIGTTDPLSSLTQLPEHVEMLRLRMAMALLPYAEWYDDAEENRKRRADLAPGFIYQLERKETNFRKYINNIVAPRNTYLDSWND